MTELSRREKEVAELVAAGMTNREIATRLFVSERTAEYHVEQIRNKLGFHSRRDIRAWLETSTATDDATSNNLPTQLTSFVGRNEELAEIRSLLVRTRLLTLVGSGGSGKTRLALQLGADVLEQFPDGVWFVELATIAEGELIPGQVAAAVGVREMPGRALLAILVERFQKSRTLLVLDSCEHLKEPVAGLVEALLRASVNLTVMATSQEVLHAEGELSWRVPSLDEELGVRLFVERARQVNPHFELGAGAETVAQICRRLDGIPLAIELAAARIAVLSPAEILERLDDRLRLLTGGRGSAQSRQKTLRAALDWSYGLLSGAEQTLLARLSVFVGGWRLESAEAVCVGGEVAQDEVLNLLTRLIDKSLVVIRPSEPGTRYELLDTLRQYALGRLEAGGAADQTRLRQAEHFAAMGLAVAGRLGPSGWKDVHLRTERAADELANLRAALQFARRDEPALALRVATQLSPLLRRDGHLSEARSLLVELLAAWSQVHAVRFLALLELRIVTFTMGDYELCLRTAREALQIAQAIGELKMINEARIALGLVNRVIGRYDEATACFSAALESVSTLGEEQDAERLRVLLATTATAAGDWQRARFLLSDLLVHVSPLSDVRPEVTFALAIVELLDGDAMLARDHLIETAAAVMPDASRYAKVNGIYFMAAIESALGHPEAALRLAGAADALNRAQESVLSAVGISMLQPFIDRARALFDSDRVDLLWSEGSKLSLDEATQYSRAEHTS